MDGRKKITEDESKFAQLIAIAEMGSMEAARIAFGWRCETGSPEAQKARDLARSPRIRHEIEKLKAQALHEAEAESIVDQTGAISLDTLRDFAYKKLETIRDNPNAKSAIRFQAIKTLEKLHDPSQDINLIWKWIDLCWRYQKAHCPSCHESFALTQVRNPKLDNYRTSVQADPVNHNLTSEYERRLELLKRADIRRTPHAAQVRALNAPERHVVGLGAARAGKSYLLALFAITAFLLPGVEIWILAETYESARSEVEYLENFLKSLFHPYEDTMVKTHKDTKTGEYIMESKWGSELRIKSAKSKGTITGRALEAALVAEPGWVPVDIYNHLRARMSERLGRIIALGTPQGTAGFLGRLVKMTGRDPKSGRIIRRHASERLLENGSPWSTSMLVYNINPEDNPEFVISELDAARQELTDEEYASEFAGEMRESHGLKFSKVIDKHLQAMPTEFFANASYVLGVDQGPRNFGAILTAYDGDTIVPCFEYMNNDETTMHANLKLLRRYVPRWIDGLGGDPNDWLLTITDRDPQLDGIFEEFLNEGIPWPTEVVTRHLNKAAIMDNWRRETQEWVNIKAERGKLLFHEAHTGSDDYDILPGALLLHDQVMTCADVPEDPERESKTDSKKGWTVSDPFRGDHVMDAWYFTMWTILSGQLNVPVRHVYSHSEDPWAEHKAAASFALARDEMNELRTGGKRGENVASAYESFFNRPMHSGFITSGGNYGDES